MNGLATDERAQIRRTAELLRTGRGFLALALALANVPMRARDVLDVLDVLGSDLPAIPSEPT